MFIIMNNLQLTGRTTSRILMKS